MDKGKTVGLKWEWKLKVKYIVQEDKTLEYHK